MEGYERPTQYLDLGAEDLFEADRRTWGQPAVVKTGLSLAFPRPDLKSEQTIAIAMRFQPLHTSLFLTLSQSMPNHFRTALKHGSMNKRRVLSSPLG